MTQDPEQAGAVGPEVMTARRSRLRRPLVLVLVSLGLVSGGAAISATAAGAAISATAAGAASSSSETATAQESSSDASATQAQEGEEGDEAQRDCPEKQEAEESA